MKLGVVILLSGFLTYSTRPYIVSLFGKPNTDYGSFSMYHIENDTVAFEYADNYCDESQPPWSRFNGPEDTVLKKAFHIPTVEASGSRCTKTIGNTADHRP